MSEIFVRMLEEDIKNLYNTFKFAKEMAITRASQFKYDASDVKCHICGENFQKIIVISQVSFVVPLLHSDKAKFSGGNDELRFAAGPRLTTY